MITNRFDIPKPVRDFLAVAVASNIIDPAEVFCLAGTFGSDWRAIIDSVTEAAHVSRLHNKEGNAAVCRAAEAALGCLAS